MSVAETLDRFRESLPGCDLVVLADITTEMVLASSADLPPSQERLDAMTAQASASITGPVGEGASLLLEGDPDRPDMAVLMSGGQTQVFVGASSGRAEALLISLRSGTSTDGLFDCAQRALADILASN